MAAARASWLGFAYFTGLGDVERHHVETAWLLYAAALGVSAFAASRKSAQPTFSRPSPASSREWLLLIAMIGVAGVIYATALRIGLLSDDFVSLDRARNSRFLDPAWPYIRPIPLLVWAAIDAGLPPGWVPVALHALNVALHGVNATLVYAITRRLGMMEEAALAAAFIFLVFPLNVEAVAWCSGIFDLLMATILLVLALVGRKPITATSTIVVVLLTAAAVLTKESGVVAPGVLALAVISRGCDRASARAIAAASGLVVVYLACRPLFDMPPASLLPASGYQAKEMLTRPFAALAMPVHDLVTARTRLVPASIAMLWPIAFIVAAIHWRRSPRDARIDIGLCASVLLSTLPLLTMLHVGSDLQGARYLYFGSAAAAIFLGRSVLGPNREGRRIAGAVVIALIAGEYALLRHHLEPWRQAADIRDRVLGEVVGGHPACEERAAHGLPDSVNGAYIFRNGFEQACRRAALTFPTK